MPLGLHHIHHVQSVHILQSIVIPKVCIRLCIALNDLKSFRKHKYINLNEDLLYGVSLFPFALCPNFACTPNICSLYFFMGRVHVYYKSPN